MTRDFIFGWPWESRSAAVVNVGEEGAHQLFDRWVNLLDKYLETSGIGNSFSGASGFPIASDWEIIDWR